MNLRIFLAIVACGLLFLFTSMFLSPFHYDGISKVLLAGTYLLLSAVFWFLALTLARLRVVGNIFGALALGNFFAYYVHEQTPWIFSSFVLLCLIFLFSFACYWIIRNVTPKISALQLLMLLFSSGLFFCLFLGISYERSNVFRWHLLRHNSVIGLPTYYVLATPVPQVLQNISSVTAAWRKEIRTTREQPMSVSSEKRAPNVVFILIDALRADSLSAYGGSPDIMPRMNKLAQHSCIFKDVTTNAPWTKPSVASFFTGLLPEEHGAIDRFDTLSSWHTTLAEVLKGFGYQTLAFQSNYGAVGKDSGLDQGFDEFFEVKDNLHNRARSEDVNRSVFERFARTDHLIRTPFFLYIHYLDVHDYTRQKYRRVGVLNPRMTKALYQKMATHTDEQISQLIRFLQSKYSRQTIFFITADHGEEFGEHGEFGHGQSLYQELLRIPAILYTGTQSGEINPPLEARDFFSLLVTFARQEPSIVDWAQNHARKQRYASTYLSTDFRFNLLNPFFNQLGIRMVTNGRYKLIWSAYGETFELYDLSVDKEERVNLADNQPIVRAQLEKQMRTAVRYWFPPEAVKPSPDKLEQLRSLGYVQ